MNRMEIEMELERLDGDLMGLAFVAWGGSTGELSEDFAAIERETLAERDRLRTLLAEMPFEDPNLTQKIDEER